MTSTITWDSNTKLKKSKLLNVFDLADDGRDLDIATCFVRLEGLDFNSCYNVKVTLNPLFNPEAPSVLVSDSDAKSAVAVLELITAAMPPRVPIMNKPDIIHFDHVITSEAEEVHNDIHDGDDYLFSGDNAGDSGGTDGSGISVVDRLERFKTEQLERKRAAFEGRKVGATTGQRGAGLKCCIDQCLCQCVAGNV